MIVSHQLNLIMVRWECQHLADPRQGREKGTALTTLVNKYHARDALITECIYLLQHVSNPEWITEVARHQRVGRGVDRVHGTTLMPHRGAAPFSVSHG